VSARASASARSLTSVCSYHPFDDPWDLCRYSSVSPASPWGGQPRCIRVDRLGNMGCQIVSRPSIPPFPPPFSLISSLLLELTYSSRRYGLRLILPLTDQYDYYHGGIPTFLRFQVRSTPPSPRHVPTDLIRQNLTATNPVYYAPFYDINGPVFVDFKSYLSILISHRSNITGVSIAHQGVPIPADTMRRISSRWEKTRPS
jgi:hypothetical protein